MTIRKPKAKQAARILRDTLKGYGVELNHARSLELVAHANGFRHYNAMKAHEEQEEVTFRKSEQTNPIAIAKKDDPFCRCEDCLYTCLESELDDIKHFSMRVSPGEVCPAGECPKCGALSHILNKDDDSRYL